MKKRTILATWGATLIPAAAMAQSALPVPTLTGTRLDIVAEGVVLRAPDVATINAGVVTQAEGASKALADNSARMSAVVAALKRAGVADRDVQTSSISLSPQYRYEENVPPVITGYQASNQVTVRFRDVKRSGAILDALVAQGANQINGPSFSLDKPDSALDEARVAAITQARARAELYARAAGLRVKRILTISETGGFAPPPYPMAMMARGEAKSADTPVEAGEQRMTVNVSVSFELQ